MNLLLINYEYPPIGGGGANATKNIADSLVKLNHTVVVLAARYKNYKGVKNEDGVIVYRCPSLRKKQEQSNIFEMLTYILTACFFIPYIGIKYNIKGAIIFFSFPCGPLGLICKFLLKIPYIISLRGGDVPGAEPGLDKIHNILKPLRRLVFKKSMCIVANSEGLKHMSEMADPYPVVVIPNGVNTEFYHPSIKNSNEVFQILFVGRFQEQKNLFFLLDQVAILKSSIHLKFVLHLVGDGYQKDDLFLYSKEKGIEESIKWHGWKNKSELRNSYQQSDCLVNPSLYEGMPNVVLEAMACGLPVIASNVAGNNTVVEHGENGFLFDLNKPKDFREALILLMEDSNMKNKLSKYARECVLSKFSWKNTTEEYLILFHDRGRK